LKLAAGQAWAAWRRYPAVRRELVSAAPGPTILVTGMYRTGTSWTGSVLAAAGLWHLHEPFNPNRRLWPDELAYAPAGAPRPAIDRLVGELLEGRHRSVLKLQHAGRWFTPLRLLPLRPGRVLLKDPSAALLSEYLVRRHDMRAVVLFRHPAAVVASFVRLGWPTGRLVAGLRASRSLMDDWLAPHASEMDAVAGRSDWLSGTVLYGCVARVLLGFANRNPVRMRRVAFEALCADPEGEFRDLYRWLGLPLDDRFHEVLAVLAAGGDDRARASPFGVVRASAAMAGRWRSDVPRAGQSTVREAWTRFDLPLYREPAEWDVDAEEAG
jgi:hypothetical protein